MKSLKTTIVVLILFLTIFGSCLYFSQAIVQSRKAVQNTLTEDMASVSRQVANEVWLQIQSKYDMMRILSKTAINDIASGNADLTKRLDLKHTKKEVASIVDGFNKFVEKLHEIVSSIKNTELQLSSVDENLQTSTNETITDISDILNNINSFYIGP